MHDAPLQPGMWWACDQPERPPVEFKTCFDENCPRCVIGMRAAIATNKFPVEKWWHQNEETGLADRRLDPFEVLEKLRLVDG